MTSCDLHFRGFYLFVAVSQLGLHMVINCCCVGSILTIFYDENVSA